MGFIAPIIKAITVYYASAGAVTQFFIKLAALAAFNVATSKLFGPDLPKEGFSGPQVTVASGIEYRKIVFGKALVSGPLLYRNLSGSNGEYLWTSVALCDGEISAVTEVWLDDRIILDSAVDWTPGALGADGSGTGAVSTSAFVGKDATTAAWAWWSLGHEDQVVPAVLNSAFGGDISSSWRNRGTAVLTVKLLYTKKTEKVWESGAPNDYRALVDGWTLYDRRKDALNDDPDFVTLERPHAIGGGLKWTRQDYSALPFLSADSYSVASGVLTVTDNNNTSDNFISEMITVDTTKRYIATVDAQQTAGDRKNYLGVAFFDSNGDNIPVGGSDATGWAAVGTYHYFHNNAVFAGSWTTYAIDFGVGGTATIPTGAVTMAFIGLLTRDGAVGTNTTVQLRSCAIHEYVTTRHDYDDSSTWEWSDNPSLCVANYLLRVMGVSYDTMRWSTFNDAANFCDEMVVVPPAASPENKEKRFTCNGVLSLGDTHRDNINKLVSSMDGFLTRAQGKWQLRSSDWEEPSLTLTEDDIDGPLQVRGSAPLAERFNTVVGWFYDPDRNYEPAEFPHVSAAAYIARDGGKILKRDLELPMTNSSTMAQRIAYRLLERADNQEQISFSMGTKGAQIAIGQVVELNIADMGWTDGGNLLLHSEDLSQTWINTASTDSQLDQISPLGMIGINSINEDGSPAASHFIKQAFTAADNTFYTFSVWLKASNRTWARLDLLQRDGTVKRAYFDLGNGVPGTKNDGVVSRMETEHDGWYRCSTTIDIGSGGTSETARIIIAESDGDITFDGLSQESLLMFGAQVVAASEPGYYVPTTSAPVTTVPKAARCIDMERDGDGLYKLTFRNDVEADFADPLVTDYGTDAEPAYTQNAHLVPAPSALTATSRVGGALLEWTDPPSRTYSYIEIYASDNNLLSNASRIATVPNSPYLHEFPFSHRTQYYWVRAVQSVDDVSAYHPNNSPATSSVSASPLPDPGMSFIIDPDFDLTTSITDDGDGYWQASVDDVGGTTGTPTSVELVATGANSSNAIKFVKGDGAVVRSTGELKSLKAWRSNVGHFSVRMRYRNNGSVTFTDLGIYIQGRDSPLTGSVHVDHQRTFQLEVTGSAWKTLEFNLGPMLDDDAQFWNFGLGWSDLSVAAPEEFEIDSIFVFPVHDAARQDINIQDGNYTFALEDAGGTVYKESGGAGETYTIPGRTDVAFPVGTTIHIVNDGGGSLTIAITDDVLEHTANGGTGSRTLADGGDAVIKKVSDNNGASPRQAVWKISGHQLT